MMYVCRSHRTATKIAMTRGVSIAMTRGVSIALMLGSAIASLTVAGCRRGEAAPGEAAPGQASAAVASVYRTTVRVADAGANEPPQMFERYRGEIRSRRESRLAFRRGGIIASIDVRVGDRVTAGQTLGTLDDADVRAALAVAKASRDAAAAALDEAQAGPRRQTIAAAEASLASIEADLRLAITQQQRQRELIGRGAGSQRDFDAAKYAVERLAAARGESQQRLSELNEGTRQEQIEAARASLVLATAQIERAEVDVRDSRLVAPFDGRVADRMIDEGSIASPETAVLRIVESEPVEAVVGLPPRRAATLRVGDPVRLTMEDVGENAINNDSGNNDPGNNDSGNNDLGNNDSDRGAVIRGVVDRISPVVDATVRVRDVFVRLDGVSLDHVGTPVSMLLPGRDASDGYTSTDGPFWVPTTAMVRGVRGLWGVYVVRFDENQTRNGSVERRDVRVLDTTGSMTQIRGDVLRGEPIVTVGVHRIGPGIAVEIEKRIAVEVETRVDDARSNGGRM